jgi:von Willebrand factor type A domain-containing protein
MRSFFFLALAGCGGLRLSVIDHSARAPSNVAVYFTVDRGNGDPVPGLSADQFRIYEDGRPVSKLESKQTVLNPTMSAAHYTLLLVDMSGSVAESGQLPRIQEAVEVFTARVERYQRVGIYAFDGSPDLAPIVPLARGAHGAGALARYKPRDPSTNLYGGVTEGLKTLADALEGAEQPLRFGTLVVFTDGTDRAARVKQKDMARAVRQSPFDVFVIGVGAEIDKDELSAIGKSGVALEANAAAARQAFEKIAKRIEGMSQRYYLLSYCSPARAGQHRLRVEAGTPDGAHGSVEESFDAEGFGPGCDPAQAPSFEAALRRSRAK